MPATVAAIRAELKTLLIAAVTPDTTVQEHYPRSLPDANLPLIYIGVGPSQNNRVKYGSETLHQTREYTGTVFVRALELGNEGEAEDACEPYFAFVEDYIMVRPRVTLSSQSDGSYFTIELTGDSGIVTAPHEQKEYAVIIFRFRVGVEKLTPFVT